MYDVLVMACRFNSWTVKPFYHLMNKYWPGQGIYLFAENDYSVGAQNCLFKRLPQDMVVRGECPKWKFSDSLRFALNSVPSNNVIVLLADYWLYEQVQVEHLKRCSEYMTENPNLLRIDVGDRPRSGDMRNINDIFIECATGRDCFLPISLTPGLWSKDNYLKLLEDRWDPWMTESMCHRKFLNTYTDMRSIYCEPGPLHYTNTMRGRDDHTIILRQKNLDEVKQYIPPRFKIIFEA